MSVAENLNVGQASAPWLWTGRRLNEDAGQWLEMVGLAELDPRTLVEDLGVAEMQLVEVARLLARDAQILIFDEPTSALSDSEIDRIMIVIRRLRSEGRSLIYVTHRLSEVFELADRVTVFRDGKNLAPAEVSDLDVDRVIEMMLGREQETMFPERVAVEGAPLVEVKELLVEGLAKPVSFSIRKGEIVGLTGQLGSGAHLVVQALAGIVPSVTGQVLIEGQELALGGGDLLLDSGLAYCSADRKRNGIFAGRPIRENLSAPWLPRIARLAGWILRREERTKTRAIAEQFAVKYNRLESTVDTLSGGNQQKVAVGRWLGAEPRLILLEEPTRGVDVGARAEIYRRLRAVCGTEVGIVLASSDSGEVLGLADSIGSFYRGTLTAFRPHTEWSEESLTREVMHQEDLPAAEFPT